MFFESFSDYTTALLRLSAAILRYVLETGIDQQSVSSKRGIQINHKFRYEWHHLAKNKQKIQKSLTCSIVTLHTSILMCLNGHHKNVRAMYWCWVRRILSHFDCWWRTQKCALYGSYL